MAHSDSGFENGMLNIGGCINFTNYSIKTENFTCEHQYVYLVNTTTADVTATLPAPAANPGRIYLFKNIGTNAAKKVTIAGPINGGNNYNLFFGDSIRVMSIPALNRYETL